MWPVGDAVLATPYETTSARGLVGRGTPDVVSEAEVKRVGWRRDCRQFARSEEEGFEPACACIMA